MTDFRLETAKKLLASGIAPRDVAAELGVSLPTLYRWIPTGGRENYLASFARIAKRQNPIRLERGGVLAVTLGSTFSKRRDCNGFRL